MFLYVCMCVYDRVEKVLFIIIDALQIAAVRRRAAFASFMTLLSSFFKTKNYHMNNEFMMGGQCRSDVRGIYLLIT